MTSDVQWNASDPSDTTINESYWSALLEQGEHSAVENGHDGNGHVNGENVFPYTSQLLTHVTGKNGLSGLNNRDSDWAKMYRIMETDQIIELKVTGYNRGGLLVEWQTLRGFVPASQLVHFPITKSSEERHQALIEHVGKILPLRVIELDPDKNRLILSERAAQVESGSRREILEKLQPGDLVSGEVTNLCDFGAFIDLGGVEGLIHISELSWGRVNHPADILKRGQVVELYVIDVDEDEARIALSLKRTRPDPWVTVEQRYEIGQVIESQITNVVDFGAFARIEDGLEGLIHFSELAEGHFLHPRNVVSEGDRVQARILSIDGNARRLGLSLRPKP